MIENYGILADHDAHALALQIRIYISQGWQPWGVLQVTSASDGSLRYTQAIVRLKDTRSIKDDPLNLLHGGARNL